MNRYDFQKVAQLRTREAKLLLNNGYFSGAYYLVGYSVECALKACIAKQFKRYDFPDKKLINDSYSHNLERLLGVAGLKNELEKENKKNPNFELNWATVKDWKSQYRYDNNISEKRARDLYSACTDRKNGIFSWLKKWW